MHCSVAAKETSMPANVSASKTKHAFQRQGFLNPKKALIARYSEPKINKLIKKT
jgi:hypothetical protein